MAIIASKVQSKLRKQIQAEITRDINRLRCKNDLSVEEYATLSNLQLQLDNFYLNKAKGAFIRSRARWMEHGEKNSSYFFNLEKLRQTNKKIDKLAINGIITDNQEMISKEIIQFYSSLYKSHFSRENYGIP